MPDPKPWAVTLEQSDVVLAQVEAWRRGRKAPDVRTRTGMIVRLLAKQAMGLKDEMFVDEMFPDLFDIEHEETLDMLCASIERVLAIPKLTDADLENAIDIESFIDTVHNAALHALQSQEASDAR